MWRSKSALSTRSLGTKNSRALVLVFSIGRARHGVAGMGVYQSISQGLLWESVAISLNSGERTYQGMGTAVTVPNNGLQLKKPIDYTANAHLRTYATVPSSGFFPRLEQLEINHSKCNLVYHASSSLSGRTEAEGNLFLIPT